MRFDDRMGASRIAAWIAAGAVALMLPAGCSAEEGATAAGTTTAAPESAAAPASSAASPVAAADTLTATLGLGRPAAFASAADPTAGVVVEDDRLRWFEGRAGGTAVEREALPQGRFAAHAGDAAAAMLARDFPDAMRDGALARRGIVGALALTASGPQREAYVRTRDGALFWLSASEIDTPERVEMAPAQLPALTAAAPPAAAPASDDADCPSEELPCAQ